MPKGTTKTWLKECQNYDVAHQRSLHLLLGATAEVHRKHSLNPAQKIDSAAAVGRSHTANTPFHGIWQGPVSPLKGKTVLAERAKVSVMTTTTFIAWVTIIHQQSSNESPPFFCHVKPAGRFVYPNTVSSSLTRYLKLTSHSGIPCEHSYQKYWMQKKPWTLCLYRRAPEAYTLLPPKAGSPCWDPTSSGRSWGELREKLGWAAAQLCPTLFWETRGPALAEGHK